MAREFEVQNAEEFEKLIRSRDFRVYEALVSTILKNLKSKKTPSSCLKCNKCR